MRYFPIFVDLQGRRVVVVGGGEEATRKVRLLLKTEAKIDVIASALTEELAGNARVRWVAKTFAPELLDGATLVYSADAALNPHVSAAAQARGIQVNAVDQADISTFIIPSIVDRAPVVVAIGTEGTAPVLGQGLRAKIDALLPQTLGPLAARAAALREKVAALVPQGTRRRSFWQSFFFGDPREAFESGDEVAFDLAFHDAIHAESKPALGRMSQIAVSSDDPELLTVKAHRLLLEADVIVYGKGIQPRILEMARRDALRLAADADAESLLLGEMRKGHNVVHVFAAATAIAAPAKVCADVVPFPTREDIRDTLLKAAS